MSEPLAEATVVIRPDLSQFRAELQRELSSATRQASSQRAGITGGSRGASGNLAAQVAGATAANKKLESQANKTRASLTGLNTASGKLDAALLGLRTAAGSAAVIGLGAGALAAIALGKALRATIGLTAQFETQLNVFAATTGASAEQMERVAAAAEELGKDISLPAVTAGDAAEAMTELAKAGLSVQDALNGARGVLQLATAAAISNSAAVEIAANAINAFGLAGRDAERVADVLANAANAAQGSILDMGIALQQAAAVGRQVGLTFEDTSTFLTILARNGLRSSDAGTSLRTALIRLVNPTKEAAAKIKELGIEIRDSQGNLRVDIFQQFANATRELSPAARDAALALIGGQDAIRAFSILGRQSIGTLLRYRKELREQGTAADVAAARTKGLAGAGGALSSTLQTIATQIGLRVAPGITDFTNSLTAGISAISQSEGVISGLNSSLALLGSSLSLVGSVAATAAPVLLQAANAAGQIGTRIGVGEILAGVAAFKLLRTATAAFSTRAGSLTTKTAGSATTGLFAKGFETASVAALILKDRISSLVASLRTATGSMATFRAASLGALASLGKFAVSPLALGAAAAVAAGGLVYLLTRENATERATRNLSAATDELAASLGRAKGAAEGLAGAQRGVEVGETNVLQARLSEAQARNALAGSNAARGSSERQQLELNLRVATQNVTFATQDYTKALNSLREAQDLNIAASLASKDARDQEVKSVQDLVAALQDRGRGQRLPAEDAEREAAGIRELTNTLREQAKEAARSEDIQVQALGKRQTILANLIETYDKFPSDVATEIILTAPNVKARLDDLAREFGITGDKAIKDFNRQVLTGITPLAALVNTKVQGFLSSLVSAFTPAGTEAGGAYGDAFGRAVLAGINRHKSEIQQTVSGLTQASGRLAGIQRQATTIRIQGGGLEQQLANKQDEKTGLEDVIARLKPGPAQRRRQEELAAVIEEIASINEQIAAEAVAGAQKIQDTKDEAAAELEKLQTAADEKAIGRFTSRRDRLENLLARAGLTEGLGDDIKFNKAMRALLNKQIANARERIKNLEDRRNFIRATNDEIASITAEIKADTKRANEQRRQDARDAAQERQANILERLNLNVEFEQITEDKSGEIAARLRLIRELKRRQGLVKKTSIEYKRLKNEIAREKAAIRELKEEQKDKNDEAKNAFKEFAFGILQNQQGFAANLLGNLLPSNAGGAVGGVATPAPAAQISTAGALSESKGIQGFSNSQSATLLELTKQIVAELRALRGIEGHPEARHQRKNANAQMDVM